MLTNNKINGVFMISLDFEMFWGIRNKKSLAAVETYYADMLKQGRRGLDMTTLKN